MVICQKMRVRPGVGSVKDRHGDNNLKVDPNLGYHVIKEKRQVG